MENKEKEILKYSDPQTALKNIKKYLGPETKLFLSTKKDKKYMIIDPNTNKFIHFGQMGFSDFTQHKDLLRRERYLKRATNIKGNWKENKYSPNQLSINLLW